MNHKFIAWDLDKSEWVDFYYIFADDGCLYEIEEVASGYEPYMRRNKINCKILQWTGLKDLDGRELYFDDIINVWYGKIKSNNRETIETVEDLAYLIMEIEGSGASFEIVGNKWDIDN